MARPTNRDEALEALEALDAREKVFKVEVEELKYSVIRVFEKERDAVKDKYVFAGRYQNLTRAERDIDLAMPYELRHWMGSKFEKAIDKANRDTGGTEFLSAIMNLKASWSLPHIVLQRLIGKAVSGRRPVERTRKVIGERPQLRATCPCCFRQQAISGDCMVDHGFQLKWEQRNGSCSGVRQPHFGTVGGRMFAESLAANYRRQAEQTRKTADAVMRGEVQIRDRKTLKFIEAPTEAQLKRHASDLLGDAQMMEITARQLEVFVAKWEEKEPVTVMVEVFE
jgi:hypothetical protein